MGIVRPDPGYNPTGRDEKQVKASAALLLAEGKGMQDSRRWQIRAELLGTLEGGLSAQDSNTTTVSSSATRQTGLVDV